MDPVAEPGLVPGDVGEEAVRFGRIRLLVRCRLAEDVERGSYRVSPRAFPTRRRRGECGFEVMDGGEGAVLVDLPRSHRVALAGGELTWRGLVTRHPVHILAVLLRHLVATGLEPGRAP
jgi:hypothetical protein